MFYSIRLERLSSRSAEIAALIDLYTLRDPEFPAKALLWLDATEKTMSELRLPEGAEMSTLRGGIVKADDIARDEEGKRTRRAVTQARNAAAADALARGEQILRARITEAEDVLRRFEEKLVEAMTAAVLLGILPERRDEGREAWLYAVWAALVNRQEIRPTTVYLAAALKSVDRLYVLDRVMDRVKDRTLPVM